MKLLSSEQGKKHLENLLPRFGDCYLRTLAQFQVVAFSFYGSMNKRAKPTVFHNLLVNYIMAEFHDDKNIKFYPSHETLIIVIDDLIALRFKKLDEKGQPRNKKSDRNDQLVAQDYTLFEDVPSITLLDFGYSINETWTEFEYISVACNLNGISLWLIYITKEGGATLLTSANPNPPLPDESESGVTWIFNAK